MADFPIAEYLQAFQNKYAQDQANDSGVNIARGIAGGIGNIVDERRKEASDRRTQIFELMKDRVRGKTLKRSNGETATPDEEVQLWTNIWDKKLGAKAGKPGKSVMEFGTKDGNSIGYYYEEPVRQGYQFDLQTGSYKPIMTPEGEPIQKKDVVAPIVQPKPQAAQQVMAQQREVPEGMEITKIDAQGRPIYEKIGYKADQAAATTTSREEEKKKIKAKDEYFTVKSGYADSIGNIDKMLEINKDTYSGKAENLKSNLIRATGIGADSKTFQNTANITNMLRNYVARTLRQTFGAQLSDSERAYLDEVYGAVPGMTRQERELALNNIKNMLDLKLQEKENAYNLWYGNKTDTPQQKPTLPQPTLPQGSRFKILGVK